MFVSYLNFNDTRMTVTLHVYLSVCARMHIRVTNSLLYVLFPQDTFFSGDLNVLLKPTKSSDVHNFDPITIGESGRNIFKYTNVNLEVSTYMYIIPTCLQQRVCFAGECPDPFTKFANTFIPRGIKFDEKLTRNSCKMHCIATDE